MGEVGFLVARLQLGLSAEHPSTGLQGLLMHLLMSCLDFASFGCCCWVVFFFCFSFLSVSLVAFSFFFSFSFPSFFTCPLVLFVSIPDGLVLFSHISVGCACTSSLVSMSASYSSCEGTSSFQFMSLRVLKLFSHRLDLFFFIGGVYCLFVTSQVIE